MKSNHLGAKNSYVWSIIVVTALPVDSSVIASMLDHKFTTRIESEKIAGERERERGEREGRESGWS